MSNTYLELKEKHQAEVNAFPMVFAFTQKQFEEGMEKLGLKATDTDKIRVMGGGGFYKRTDGKALAEMVIRHDKEMETAIQNDTKGEGFIFEMFDYELGNHEYSYTRELDATLDALDLTIEEIDNDARLSYGLYKARKHQMENDCV